ncbi:hypothetical protein [Massilia sp. IC2-476]|uniref:hypothetical protein n=1 Tax=Massilia sp. IC2-476 TaxID=2887199 RepID=UPI001D116FBE|nr:hypothetical protein [Massilia sp. IC2-476]MCC2970318.1 hypothetical protein [Massilia sp. IC2-476]
MKRGLSLHEAEKAFRGFGCSHYLMGREDLELLTVYKNLAISSEQETEWTKASFRELAATLDQASTPAADLWWKHASATTHAESIGQIEVLRELYRVSSAILHKVPDGDCIMCAENILARGFVELKRGVVFLACSLGDPALATGFLHLARAFAGKYTGADHQRLEQAMVRAETIHSMIVT